MSTMSQVCLRTLSNMDSQRRASGQRLITPRRTGTRIPSARTGVNAIGACASTIFCRTGTGGGWATTEARKNAMGSSGDMMVVV